MKHCGWKQHNRLHWNYIFLEEEVFLTCKQLQIFRKRLLSPFSGPVQSKNCVNPEDGNTKQLRKYRKHFFLYIMSSARRRQRSWSRYFQTLLVNDRDFGYVKSTYITSTFWKITRKEDTWTNKEYMEKSQLVGVWGVHGSN